MLKKIWYMLEIRAKLIHCFVQKLCITKTIWQTILERKLGKEYEKLVWEDIKNINKDLPTFKHIKEIILTDEPLEKTTTQKVKRFVELKKLEKVK